MGPQNIGDYEVQWHGPFQVKSVRLNGRKILGRYFHLGAVNSYRLEVESTGEVAQISGTMTIDESLPMAEAAVREMCSVQQWPRNEVILFPEPLFVDGTPEKVFHPRLVREASSGEEGRFYVSNVLSGKYRALAIQSLSGV